MFHVFYVSNTNISATRSLYADMFDAQELETPPEGWTSNWTAAEQYSRANQARFILGETRNSVRIYDDGEILTLTGGRPKNLFANSGTFLSCLCFIFAHLIIFRTRTQNLVLSGDPRPCAKL